MTSTEPVSGERVTVWSRSDTVVAAMVMTASGFVWCGNGRWDGLEDDLRTSAALFDVRPEDTQPITELDAVRACENVMGRATRAFVDLASLPETPRQATALAERLVTAGLSEPGPVTRATWPGLVVDSLTGEPSSSMAALLGSADVGSGDVGSGDDLELRRAEREVHEAERQLRRAREAADALRAARAERAGRMAAVVTEEEFVSAVVDGLRAWNLQAWSDALVGAVESLAAEGPWLAASLSRLLRQAWEAGRAPLDVFGGYLEAPPEIIALYQRHGGRLRDVIDQRDDVVGSLVADAAAALHRSLGEFRWSDLVERGFALDRPPAPPADDDW